MACVEGLGGLLGEGFKVDLRRVGDALQREINSDCHASDP